MIKNWLLILAVVVLVAAGIFFSLSRRAFFAYAFTNTGGGDHGGADWTPANGTYIAGSHTNIGTFTVAAGTTVYVQPYDGTNYGNVSINAQTINIQGTLTAAGNGYGGGGGGGGISGANSVNNAGGCLRQSGGTAGSGGSGTAGGSNGGGGTIGITCCENNSNPTCSYSGAGGKGGGSYGGAGGASAMGNGAVGNSGGNGGYAVNGGNGDGTTDESLLMGSGGGGGSGGSPQSTGNSAPNEGAWGAGGGGAGNSGGGFIKLYASSTLSISGAVNANGLSGTTGNGGNANKCPSQGNGGTSGNGGNANNSGSSSGGSGSPDRTTGCIYDSAGGGSGAAGAGGGILLKSPSVSVTGSINALGGGGSTTNGGTIKIFWSSSGSWSSANLNYGRLYTAQFNPSVDCGFRFETSHGIVSGACKDPADDTTPLRIEKSGKTYGIITVDTSGASASPIRIETPNGIEAIKKR